MPTFDSVISDFTVGDDLEVIRQVGAIPAGRTVAQAWFTVKDELSDLDNAAVFQKIIDPVLDVNQGVVSDVGAGGTATLNFYLLSTDTVLLGLPTRPSIEGFFDIQVQLDNGKIYTAEIGKIIGKAQVTFAS